MATNILQVIRKNKFFLIFFVVRMKIMLYFCKYNKKNTIWIYVYFIVGKANIKNAATT